MNQFELSKPQKKIARTLIDSGLMKDYKNGIMMVDEIIREWKNHRIAKRVIFKLIW